MPIRPENRARYPANWASEIRPAILARAGNRCEQCKAPNGEVICRGEGQNEQGTYMLSDGEVFDADDGSHIGQARMSDYVGRFITVLLTVAHLDHQPENCDPDNLRAWCQRCHLAYDQQHHAETAAATRRAKKATGDLFTNSPAGPASQEHTMDDQSIEQEIKAKGKTAPRVTPTDIEAEIVDTLYFTAADGVKGQWLRDASMPRQADLAPDDPAHLLTFCVLRLRNGFTVTGESACASPENFDAELGRKIARQNAVAKLWPLLGFRLRDKLASA